MLHEENTANETDVMDLLNSPEGAEPVGISGNTPMAGPDDFAVPKKNRSSHGTILLLIVCIAAVVMIYFLGLRHRPKEATAEELAVDTQLDLALAQLLATQPTVAPVGGGSATEVLIQTFYDYPSSQQIPLAQLTRNPFRPDGAMVLAVDTAAERRIARLKELQEKLALLSLESTLIGPQTPKCAINGEVLGVGEWVDDFQIKRIGMGTVTLAAEHREFILEM